MCRITLNFTFKPVVKIMKNKIFIAILSFTVAAIAFSGDACLAKRAKIYTSAKVESFGNYSYEGSLNWVATSAGEFLIGELIVKGAYNEEYPWIMRIYTDNINYTGLAGSIRGKGPAGLVSTDGRFTIPIKVHCPNFGKDEWRIVPDINQPNYRNYLPSTPKIKSIYTDCILMGIDPRNADWVAGGNQILFDADDNIIGDMTISTPFDIRLKAKFDPTSVKANYTANLYIEIVPAP